MSWTIAKIRKSFSGRLIGTIQAKNTVCKTLQLLPNEIIYFVTKKVWIISSSEDAWALTFRGSDLDGKHLIIISDALLNQELRDFEFTILHEIGHVVLNHKNSIGIIQTQADVDKQEKEANLFASKYLKIKR